MEGTAGTVCVEIRERLTENALSTLRPDERSFVGRHLEWCAGCRKEARELQEGAAIAGMALPPLDPPAELQHRLVAGIHHAVSAGRPGKGRSYLRRSATILAQ